MVNHKKFLDIKVADSTTVGGFEVGDHIIIQTKVDGANAAIRYDSETDKVVAQSRKHILSSDNNLRGFYEWSQLLDKDRVKEVLGDRYVLFMEYSCPHKIKYAPEFTNKVFCYDAYDLVDGKWMPQSFVEGLAKKLGLMYVFTWYEGDFISWEHCKSFLGGSVYGEEQQEGCFNSRAKILMADGTQKFISQIQVGDTVKSYNVQSKSIEDKKVVNVFYNGKKPVEEWRHIAVFPRGYAGANNLTGKFQVTNTHKFFDGKSYTEIQNMDYVYHYGLIFDKYRYNAFLGLICSDGCYSRKRYLIYQKTERVNDLEELFKLFTVKPQYNTSGKGTNMTTLSFRKSHTDAISDEFVVNGKFDYVKAFSEMDDVGWAYFFLGDGSYPKGHECQFGLYSYSAEEVEEIRKSFEKRFGIQTTVAVDKKVSTGSGMYIRMSSTNSKMFAKRISKYIPPSHRYKLNTNIPESELTPFMGFPDEEYGLVKRKLHKNVPFTDTNYSKNRVLMGAWDIEVKDNHNYFVSGCLVHNCVIKNESKLNDPNNRQPFYVKIVNKDFQESMKKKPKVISPEELAARDAEIEKTKSIVTRARVEKILYKGVDEGVIPEDWSTEDMKSIAKYVPKEVVEDCFKEEKDTVAEIENFTKLANKETMSIVKQILESKKGALV